MLKQSICLKRKNFDFKAEWLKLIFTTLLLLPWIVRAGAEDKLYVAEQARMSLENVISVQDKFDALIRCQKAREELGQVLALTKQEDPRFGARKAEQKLCGEAVVQTLIFLTDKELGYLIDLECEVAVIEKERRDLSRAGNVPEAFATLGRMRGPG